MNIGLVIAALLPAIVLCVYIFKKDRVEKEPIGLLLLLFGLGAVSCFPVAFVEGVVGIVVHVSAVDNCSKCYRSEAKRKNESKNKSKNLFHSNFYTPEIQGKKTCI